ncbi:hypothetical protein CORC01_13327 [Colletotrichum orchidophilum]|uniref:Uncharacterized protein n=1 Tax=Colletotrichum orchidophilum TaxID=1209926 RepID=A0A1G4AQA1_9PEZI|nr:uncharacterized protein CORC01_13327 [Colletotrichum orchidophilum]OHE91350.1 hypothetical protein CORC01_13327 [Colletotrichum orchidophilum]
MSQRSARSVTTTSNGGVRAAGYAAAGPMMDRYLRSPMELPERLVSIGSGTSSTRTSSSSRQQTQRSLTAWDARWTQAGQSS